MAILRIMIIRYNKMPSDQSTYPGREEGSMLRHAFTIGMVWVLTIIFCGPVNVAAMETTIDQILANKNSYDGKEVFVTGIVSNPKLKKLTGGNEYTTFSLISESGKTVSVFFMGQVKLKSKKKVNVSGIFRKVARVGRFTFTNQIEATEIR